MRVVKGSAEHYSVTGRDLSASSVWGDIVLVCGKESVLVMASSDFGDYSYRWNSCGCEPKEFLCSVDFEYAMQKMMNGKLYKQDTSAYFTQIKEQIKEALEEDVITKEEAQEVTEEMESICDEYESSHELLRYQLYEHSFFDKIFGDSEGLPSARKIDVQAKQFWDKIWLPFISSLKDEIGFDKK